MEDVDDIFDWLTYIYYIYIKFILNGNRFVVQMVYLENL